MICVAGLTREGQHIRPMSLEDRLDRSHLLSSGGIFTIGGVVELGDVEDVGVVPEREDRLFALAAARYEFSLEPNRFWLFLKQHSQPDLDAIFGPQLQRAGGGMSVPLLTGKASLGCLRPAKTPRIALDSWGKLRAQIAVAGTTISLPVTDIRLYGEDQETPLTTRLEWLNRQVAGGVLLTVGLGRPYKAQSREREEHWLQVNNVHPLSDPLWSGAPS